MSNAVAMKIAILKRGGVFCLPETAHYNFPAGMQKPPLPTMEHERQDITPRQVRQGVADIEALAVEVERPEEKRNWKTVLDCGQRLLDLAGKATDLGAKLGPHVPTVGCRGGT